MIVLRALDWKSGVYYINTQEYSCTLVHVYLLCVDWRWVYGK